MVEDLESEHGTVLERSGARRSLERAALLEPGDVLRLGGSTNFVPWTYTVWPALWPP
jgi:hypothetical protein